MRVPYERSILRIGDLEVRGAFGVRVITNQHKVNVITPVAVDGIAADVLDGAIFTGDRGRELRSAAVAQVNPDPLATREAPSSK